MSVNKIKCLHIIPGYYCNLQCKHCANNSGPFNKLKLSDEEIEEIIFTIKNNIFEKIIFTGGEPYYYIETINKIIDYSNIPSSTKIQITSNGCFSSNSISETLSSFKKINILQLSYDIFHGTNIQIENIIKLKEYCTKNNIDFLISICISSPKDLIFASKIQQQIKTKIIYQKVENSGRAKSTNVNYYYENFEEEVLQQKCPNIGQVSYIPEKGFSICCSSLIFNYQNKSISHKNLKEHLNSKFYNFIIKNNFLKMTTQITKMKKLLPEHSSPCSLCSFLNGGSDDLFS